MPQLNPYLNFMGRTEEAFNFYKSVFGGEFTILQRLKDTPEKDKLPASDLEKIMHVALPIGGNTLMGTDTLESMGHTLTAGDNISLSLEAVDKEEAEKLFTALSQNGTVDMPLADQFWGATFGMLTDKFGIHWMVNCTHKK